MFDPPLTKPPLILRVLRAGGGGPNGSVKKFYCLGRGIKGGLEVVVFCDVDFMCVDGV